MFRQILHGSSFFLGHDGCAGLNMGINIHIFIPGEVLYYGYNTIVSYVLFVKILMEKDIFVNYSDRGTQFSSKTKSPNQNSGVYVSTYNNIKLSTLYFLSYMTGFRDIKKMIFALIGS